MNLEEIKQKKFEELKAQQETEQQFAQIETSIKQLFTPEALSRYGNVKAANPEVAKKVIIVIAQAIQSNQLTQVDDESLLLN